MSIYSPWIYIEMATQTLSTYGMQLRPKKTVEQPDLAPRRARATSVPRGCGSGWGARGRGQSNTLNSVDAGVTTGGVPTPEGDLARFPDPHQSNNVKGFSRGQAKTAGPLDSANFVLMTKHIEAWSIVPSIVPDRTGQAEIMPQPMARPPSLEVEDCQIPGQFDTPRLHNKTSPKRGVGHTSQTWTLVNKSTAAMQQGNLGGHSNIRVSNNVVDTSNKTNYFTAIGSPAPEKDSNKNDSDESST